MNEHELKHSLRDVIAWCGNFYRYLRGYLDMDYSTHPADDISATIEQRRAWSADSPRSLLSLRLMDGIGVSDLGRRVDGLFPRHAYRLLLVGPLWLVLLAVSYYGFGLNKVQQYTVEDAQLSKLP